MGLEFNAYPYDPEVVEENGPSELEICEAFDRYHREDIEQKSNLLMEAQEGQRIIAETLSEAQGQPLPQMPDGAADRLAQGFDSIFRQSETLVQPSAAKASEGIGGNWRTPLDPYMLLPEFDHSVRKPPYSKFSVGLHTVGAVPKAETVTDSELRKGGLGAVLNTILPGGSAYASTMTGDFITIKPKVTSVRITAHFRLDYWYFLSGLLGYASMELKLVAGAFDGDSFEAYNENVLEKNWTAAIGFMENSGYDLSLSVSALSDTVKPGRKYYVYGGIEQWAGSGGIAGAAKQYAWANLYGIEITQFRGRS